MVPHYVCCESGGVPKRSAGLLLYRYTRTLEVLLAHPGGPLWAKKDQWTVPKGEYTADEEPLAAAYREFAEELGSAPPAGEPIPLGEVTQKSGKLVTCWGLAGDLDASLVVSNTFTMRWAGRVQQFPEVDRAEWFSAAAARSKLMPAQVPFLDRLAAQLDRH